MWEFAMASGAYVAGRNFYQVRNFYRLKILKVQCVIYLTSFSQHPYSKSLDSSAIWILVILRFSPKNGARGDFRIFVRHFFKKWTRDTLTLEGATEASFWAMKLGKRGQNRKKLKFLFLRAIYTHFVKEKTQVKYKTFWGEKLRKCLTKLSLGPISLHFTKLVERWVRNHFAMGLRSLRSPRKHFGYNNCVQCAQNWDFVENKKFEKFS